MSLREDEAHLAYLERLADEPYIDPDTWQAWVAKCSSGRGELPPLGAPQCGYPPLGDAPGIYVLQS